MRKVEGQFTRNSSQSYQFSQDSSSYRFMKDKMCGSDMCIQAANQGHLLCDAGIDDCYKMDNTYGCDSGVPLIDSCEVLAEDSNWTCPQISGNYSKILDYGRSVRSIAYNAKTLYRLNPDYILNFTSKLTDSEIRQQLTGSSSSERHSLALHLLHSMRFALNESPSVFESSINWSRSSSDFPSTSLTKKLQAAGVFLHLIAEIARQTPTLINTLASGEENQNNLRLLHLRSEDTRVSMNNSYGNVLELFAKPKGSEARDAVVAVIPTAKIPGIILTKVDSAERKIDRSQLIGSDIVLVDTSSGVSFTVSVDLSQKPNVSVSCEQLQRSAGFTEMWNEGNCKTVVVGLYFECQCLPSQDGTFAVALVYWLGVSHIPFTHVYSISIVNYIFTLITIVALFLFLIFTRFIGIFRLDQFNIAFCLMISSVVSLTIPHTTDKQPILCTMIAVAVCYFPLAAFSWKFIFGLNTLVLIVAPHSRFHDLVSKPKNCISLVWIGYLTPAVIIGIWFGYTGEISNGGLCIGPKTLRWSFIGPITAVVTFNFVILLVVGFVLLRNYFLTRKSKLNKTTHLLVLTQLMLTLGIPYIAIYIQLLDAFSMLIVVPVAMALTAVLMFILVAIVDEENRLLLRSFIYTHITRPNEHSGITTCKSKCEIVSNSKKPIDNSEITFDLSNYLANTQPTNRCDLNVA
ncbi:unnamed protein product [Heterobilharzia americana]|nr:unnamed protein product [Heterobilharzia americana]